MVRFHLYEVSRTGRSIETERLVVPWAGGGKNGEWLLMGTGSPFGVMEMFWNWMKWWLLNIVKILNWIVHFRWFILREFHLEKTKWMELE